MWNHHFALHGLNQNKINFSFCLQCVFHSHTALSLDFPCGSHSVAISDFVTFLSFLVAFICFNFVDHFFIIFFSFNLFVYINCECLYLYSLYRPHIWQTRIVLSVWLWAFIFVFHLIFLALMSPSVAGSALFLASLWGQILTYFAIFLSLSWPN